jgi:hypothetical protein
MILDDDVEQTMVIVTVKELQDRMAMKRRRGSIPKHISSNGTASSATPLLCKIISQISDRKPSPSEWIFQFTVLNTGTDLRRDFENRKPQVCCPILTFYGPTVDGLG